MSTNTTAHLIADIEALREHLGVEAWIVNGASWGSTLAVAYALAHPERVLGVVLAAVITTGREEVDWITEASARSSPKRGIVSPPSPSRPASATTADTDE
ncbi:alpha/beta fold hydrolase [Rhodococcus sp. BS-15]|uniref:alpha/beta fold hydrolase n=1 Tax=Rhodococcus sp. BS-15 TaxID=1304954 RepID=UPI000B1FC64A|nr:alpha/beta fold hydrolase [Rhodococcus sp. BS-15]